MADRNARRVREMFSSIAPRYDLLNRLLSLSVDRYWRHVVRKRLTRTLPLRSRLLDLCTGTGDLAIELGGEHRVVGCDFAHPMLVRAARKVANRPGLAVLLVEGDALDMPFRDGRFDAVTIAFGFRNLECYDKGLNELNRVLKDGGILAILEFSQPATPLFRQLFRFYFHRVLPRLGALVSGRSAAYTYLPDSVDAFPSAPALATMMERAGFHQIEYRGLTGSIATLHLGTKGSSPPGLSEDAIIS